MIVRLCKRKNWCLIKGKYFCALTKIIIPVSAKQYGGILIMNKTRFLMFSMVLLLSLCLVGMAMAADSLPQIKNPPVDEDSSLDTTSDTANDIPTPPAIVPDPEVSEVEAELQAESTYPRLVNPSSTQKAPVSLPGTIYFLCPGFCAATRA